MKNTHHNYTLIEMLTVIAIIAILSGLVIPAVGRARVSAKTAACISNQGQTMKIIQQSINDNDGFFLAPAETTTWSQKLFDKNYIQDVPAIRCPAIPDYTYKSLTGLAAADQTAALQQVYGAAYTAYADGFDFRGTKYLICSGAPISPAALAIGGCSVNSSKNADARLGFGSAVNGAPYEIHAKFCNFFFLDGHAESLAQADAHKRYYPNETGTAANRAAAQITRDYVKQQ